MNPIWCGLAVLLILYLLSSTEGFSSGVDKICNELDGRCYNIHLKYDNTDDASKLLAELNIFAIKFLRHLRNKYIWQYHPNDEAKSVIEFLLSNYNPDGIIENAPVGSVNTSFVDNKGEILAICLREKASGKNKFHKMHDLQFVVLHEMSHMATESFGHQKEFWINFKFLLKEAEEAGLHSPINYKKNNMVYCSLTVDYSPYFDESLPELYKH